jgi:hypothetical protein
LLKQVRVGVTVSVRFRLLLVLLLRLGIGYRYHLVCPLFLAPTLTPTLPKSVSKPIPILNLNHNLGVKFNKGIFPFSANSRARTTGDFEGMIKVLADKETDRILGMHIIGMVKIRVKIRVKIMIRVKLSSFSFYLTLTLTLTLTQDPTLER